MNLRRNRDRVGLQELQDKLIEQTKTICKQQGKPTFTEEQIEVYTNVGGTPFLDNQYTVFGEVVDGMDVVDSIQVVPTGKEDRPLEDVVIRSMKIVEE